MTAPFDRRHFLRVVAGSVIVLPVGRFLVACGSEDETYEQGANAPAAAPRADGTNVVFSSSAVSGHFHTFPVAMAAMAAPPSSGLGGDTSASAGHVHSVSVSMAQLASVAAGETVQVTTGSEGGHSHVLSFVKLQSTSGAPDAGTGTGSEPDARRETDPYDPD
jgi:hypothetical protein